MKKIMLGIMILILASPVYAIYGGETLTIFDGECSELLVNISIAPYQNDSEYVLEPNCDVLSFENNVKSFNCTCANRTTLNLTTAVNSVGNYTYTIEQYIMKDNETTEPIAYTTGNPTSKDITTTITLPNNIIIERTIPPNEELVYVETDEGCVIIPESNVTFESIDTDDTNINMQVTSSGEKCFDIYAENGKPYSIIVNDIPITFNYNDTTKMVDFCLTFSTKNIYITWDVPPTLPEITGGEQHPGITMGTPPTITEEEEEVPEEVPTEEVPTEEAEEEGVGPTTTPTGLAIQDYATPLNAAIILILLAGIGYRKRILKLIK